MNLSRIKGVTIQNIFWLRHSLEDVADTFFWPMMDVIIWGLMTTYFSRLEGPLVGVVNFLLGGLILWNIVWRAQQDISFALLRNVWGKNLLNLFTTPLTPGEFIVATMGLGLLKIIFTVALVSTIAFFLYSFNIFSLGFYLLPFFINLIVFGWTAGTFITALIVRYGMRIQAFAWSLIALFHPISAVFYPVATLPLFLQKIAWLLPTSHIFEGMRQVLKIGTVSTENLIWASLLNVVYLFLASRFFVFMFEKAREKGKLAKSNI